MYILHNRKRKFFDVLGKSSESIKDQEVPNFFDFATEKLWWKFVFKDVLNFIDIHFNFSPVRFSIGEIDDTKEGITRSTDWNWNDIFINNGEVVWIDNKNPEKTAGSCKVLAYAKLLWPKTSPLWVLHLFWEHYNSLFGENDWKKVFIYWKNHPNIRALIKWGLDKVQFEWNNPLTPKTKK